MKYASLPDNIVRPLPFYLAMEEYLAREKREECELFFMWQVEPTVIFGRNQLMYSEVNLNYCNENGISVYRRKSGGGCVYADMSNIMFSYIESSDNIETSFTNYTERVANMLKGLGLDASANSRNDILIGDRKVSGNAFYHIPGRSIAHGTMLYDTDMAHMLNAITPSQVKLQSKGINSVKSRITTIVEHSDIGIEEFKSYARNYMCDGTIFLTEADIAEIEKISQPYYSDEWISGHNPRCSLTRELHLGNVGDFRADIELVGNRIRKINLSGDFFVLSDLDTMLLDTLKGVAYDRLAIYERLARIDPSTVISGMDFDNFVNLIIE